MYMYIQSEAAQKPQLTACPAYDDCQAGSTEVQFINIDELCCHGICLVLIFLSVQNTGLNHFSVFALVAAYSAYICLYAKKAALFRTVLEIFSTHMACHTIIRASRSPAYEMKSILILLNIGYDIQTDGQSQQETVSHGVTMTSRGRRYARR